jgi:hypothetical protein
MGRGQSATRCRREHPTIHAVGRASTPRLVDISWMESALR